MQVDLRGLLGERSWLQPVLHAVGWVDAYVERMLMAVILVKDEVSRLLTGCLAVVPTWPGATAGACMFVMYLWCSKQPC
jgi:hypothetical protein